MTTRRLLYVARASTHVAFAVAAFGALYSFKNYYVNGEIVVEGVRAIATSDAARNRVAEMIESRLVQDKDTAAIKGIVRSEQAIAKMVHDGWLEHTEMQGELLLNQLVMWLVAWCSSLCALLAQHWKRAKGD
jgi:hypothetical protein